MTLLASSVRNPQQGEGKRLTGTHCCSEEGNGCYAQRTLCPGIGYSLGADQKIIT